MRPSQFYTHLNSYVVFLLVPGTVGYSELNILDELTIN